MEAATAAAALPRIHPNQPKKKIREPFAAYADGILRTVMRIDHVDGARAGNISFQKLLLFFSSFFSLEALLLGVLESLKDSTHSALLANLF
jgi:hypothetical protein